MRKRHESIVVVCLSLSLSLMDLVALIHALRVVCFVYYVLYFVFCV